MSSPDCWEKFSRSIRAQAAKAGLNSMAALHRATGIDENRLHYMLEHPQSIKMRELAVMQPAIGVDLSALTDVLMWGGRYGKEKP